MASDWNARASATANARSMLPQLVATYFAETRQFLDTTPAPADLHQLRLSTKRLRYTLELFRPCYGPGLEQRLATLRGLQQILGEVNDCVATWVLLEGSLRAGVQREGVKGLLTEQAEAKTREFLTAWNRDFGEGKEQWWVGYLARNARHSGADKGRSRLTNRTSLRSIG